MLLDKALLFLECFTAYGKTNSPLAYITITVGPTSSNAIQPVAVILDRPMYKNLKNVKNFHISFKQLEHHLWIAYINMNSFK